MASINSMAVPDEPLNCMVVDSIIFKKVFGLSILRNERVKRRNLCIGGVSVSDLS